MSAHYPIADKTLANTHSVENQPSPLVNYNTFLSDAALQQAVVREGAEWALSGISEMGQLTGREDIIQLGFAANKHKPTLETHSRFGERIDEVSFHPSYHQLMQLAIEQGLHASPWQHPGPGAHVARAAKYYLQAQVEAAHGCPITMTFAALPALQHQPELAALWQSKILSNHYDPRNIPAEHKRGVTLGMGMTEKQGGSDVRLNSTRAYAIDSNDPSKGYELVGHKWFVSAPMCDLFLMLAQTDSGLSCFLVPRWRPDGSKNPVQLQQLKDKMGNVANASSETELRGAFGWLVGAEGKGVRTIIEMVAMTRYDCMIGSSAGMRQAVVQAIHHCQQRRAFGALLVEQPLMQNLLADLALESEAAMTLTLRVARALDQQDDTHNKLLARLAVPVGKYWICKRAPNHAYEAMEVIGGMGVMENTIMPRLFRESPVNSIWEGSGNVQCLDILRVIERQPDALTALFTELNQSSGIDTLFDDFVVALRDDCDADNISQYQARNLADRLALALQAALLIKNAPTYVADAFCRSRLQSNGGLNYGNLPADIDCQAIIKRSFDLKVESSR